MRRAVCMCLVLICLPWFACWRALVLIGLVSSAGLAIKKHVSCDQDEFFVMIGAPQGFMEFVATRLQIPCKKSTQQTGKDPKTGEETVKVVESYEPFDMFEKDNFVSAPDDLAGHFAFQSKPTLEIVESIITDVWDPTKNRFGAGVDVNDLRDAKIINSFYPQHDKRSLAKLRENWGRFRLVFDYRTGLWKQPYNEIKDYFGEKIAMYFVFLGFYTRSLISPLLWGAVSGILYYVFDGTEHSYIGEWANVAYCVQVAAWACIFLEQWKRKESRVAYDWGMRGLDDTELPLPSFEGQYDDVMDTKVYSEEKERRRKRTIQCHYVIVATCVVAIMIFYVTLEQVFQKKYKIGRIVGGVNAGSIVIFNEMFKSVAEWLTDRENFRTETEFTNSLISKRFLFQFVNSYLSLYMTAFIKPWGKLTHETSYQGVQHGNRTVGNSVGTHFGVCSCKTYLPAGCDDVYECEDSSCSNMPTALCGCETFNCAADVQNLLIVIFGIQIFWGNMTEVLVPRLSHWLKERREAQENEGK